MRPWYTKSSFWRICSVRKRTLVNFFQILWPSTITLFWEGDSSIFHKAESLTGSNWLKSPRQRTIGNPPIITSEHVGADHTASHFLLIFLIILAPTMLTSSMMRTLMLDRRFRIFSIDDWF